MSSLSPEPLVSICTACAPYQHTYVMAAVLHACATTATCTSLGHPQRCATWQPRICSCTLVVRLLGESTTNISWTLLDSAFVVLSRTGLMYLYCRYEVACCHCKLARQHSKTRCLFSPRQLRCKTRHLVGSTDSCVCPRSQLTPLLIRQVNAGAFCG